MRAIRSSLGWLAVAVVMAQAPPETAAVTGKVTQALTGAPLVRAHVSLRSFGPNTKDYGAITTAEGSFSITGVASGTYQATVDQVGFFMPPGTDGRPAVEVVLRAGDKKEDLKLTLAPLGSISGRVVGDEGEPLESARVIVDAGQGSNSPAWDIADEKGRFKLVGLRPGRYRVKAYGPSSDMPLPVRPEIRTDGTTEVRYAPTYYGGATEFRGASRVEVKTGVEVAGVEIRMVRAPMVRLSGKLVGAPAEARNVSFMFYSRAGSSRGMGPALKKDGTFELWNVDPGKYLLSANWMNAGERVQTAPVEIEIGQSHIDNIELRVVSPADIAGTIAFEDDGARPQSTNQKQMDQKPGASSRTPRVELRIVDSGMFSGPLQSDLADGSFHLTGVRAARYRVMLSWPTAYIKSITVGSAEVDGNVLDVRNGAGAAITVHVRSDFGSITGTVSDAGGPVAGAQVALMRDDYVSTGDTSFAMADASGSYTFKMVRPGKYRIAATDDNDNAPRAGNLDDYEDVVAQVEVQPKDKLTKDLKRHPPVR